MTNEDLRTRLSDLVAQEKLLREESTDLTQRHDAVKSLIADELREAGVDQVQVGDRRIKWHPPAPTAPKLDKAALIAAGVTPDQLAKGTVPGGEKRGYIEFRTVATGD